MAAARANRLLRPGSIDDPAREEMKDRPPHRVDEKSAALSQLLRSRATTSPPPGSQRLPAPVSLRAVKSRSASERPFNWTGPISTKDAGAASAASTTSWLTTTSPGLA
jgi:hypothetical protein